MIFKGGGLFASGGETRKLVMFAVLFVIVLGVFWRSTHKTDVSSQVDQEVEQSPQTESMRAQTPQAVEELDIPESSEVITDRSSVIEKSYLFELLDAVRRASLEGLKSRSERIPFRKFFDNPEDWRGKIIHVKGKIHRLVQRQEQKVSDGLEGLYEAQIMDPDGYWYYVFIAEKPRFGTGGLVVFDGVCVMVYASESRRVAVTLAPLFGCKSFEVMQLESLPRHRTTGLITLVAVLLGAVIAILMVRGQKRQSDAIALTVESKRLARARRWVQSREKKDQES